MKRRGSQIVEFSLMLPMLVVVVAGVVDFGEYMLRMEALIHAAADGARAGARAEENPASVAETAAQSAWDATGGGGSPTFDASVTDSAPNQRLVMEASLPYAPFFGLVEVPTTIEYVCAFRLDQQPED